MAKLLDSVKELGGKIAGEEIEGDTLIEAVRDAGQKMTGKEIKGKELNDVIKETADNYHGGGGGGLDPVDELPETGDVKSLYKLPDGSIWSWYSTMKEETIEEHVELGKQYQFKFSDIDKTKIKDFLEVVKAKVVELYSLETLPENMEDDFGFYKLLVEDGLDPAAYEFPVPVGLTFEDNENSNETILARILLSYNVENKVFMDNTSGRNWLNADIYVESSEGEQNSPDYPFQNPLNEEAYDAEIEQKWSIWDGEEDAPVILTEEQMNSIKVEINPEWLEYMKTDYNFDIDLTMLDFLFKLRSETIITKDEGYRRLDDPQIKAVKGGGNTYDADDGLIFDGNGVEFDDATNGIVINDENSYIDSEGIHLVSGAGGGAGEDEWVTPNVTYVQTPTKKRDTGKLMKFNGKEVVASNALPYITEEPSEDNADGLILVVIDHEPTVKYDGYLYIITEADSSEEEEGPIEVGPILN